MVFQEEFSQDQASLQIRKSISPAIELVMQGIWDVELKEPFVICIDLGKVEVGLS
jgi:hypothetical protein